MESAVDAYNKFIDWFWDRRIWLPPGLQWSDVVTNEKHVFTKGSDLIIYPIPLAFFILFVRYVCQRIIIGPIAKYLGLFPRRTEIHCANKTLRDNPTALERLYQQCKHFSTKDAQFNTRVRQLSKKLDVDARSIERWTRKRKLMDIPNDFDKFSESSWRCLIYSLESIFGVYVLYDKAWISNVMMCWYAYPYQGLPNDLWQYYIFGSSVYWSFTFSQFFDIKRKDFWQMLIHHLTTLGLLAFSWVCNFTRVGSLVLILHDCADPFLEAAKLLRYARLTLPSNLIFIFFTTLWTVTRMFLFPFFILYSTLFEAHRVIPMFPVYYIFNSLLCLLQLMNIIWTYFIFKVLVFTLKKGYIQDARSCSESCEEEEEKKE